MLKKIFQIGNTETFKRIRYYIFSAYNFKNFKISEKFEELYKKNPYEFLHALCQNSSNKNYTILHDIFSNYNKCKKEVFYKLVEVFVPYILQLSHKEQRKLITAETSSKYNILLFAFLSEDYDFIKFTCDFLGLDIVNSLGIDLDMAKSLNLKAYNSKADHHLSFRTRDSNRDILTNTAWRKILTLETNKKFNFLLAAFSHKNLKIINQALRLAGLSDALNAKECLRLNRYWGGIWDRTRSPPSSFRNLA